MSQKKKLIGIPLWNQGENSAGATKPYLEWAKGYGQVILLSPDVFIPELDLLILPGGKDVMGNKGGFSFYNSDGERFLEHFDKFTLPKYINNRTPIWGTCRGFQTILNAFGAPIVQHMNWAHGYSKDENDLKAHDLVVTEEGEALLKGIGLDINRNVRLKVGSWHHQCILSSHIPDDFTLIAHADDEPRNIDYCVAEYIMHKTLPIAGSQGHPERGYYRIDNALIKHLLRLSVNREALV